MEILLNAANKDAARHQVRDLVKGYVRVKVKVIQPANRNQTTAYEGLYRIIITGR